MIEFHLCDMIPRTTSAVFRKMRSLSQCRLRLVPTRLKSRFLAAKITIGVAAACPKPSPSATTSPTSAACSAPWNSFSSKKWTLWLSVGASWASRLRFAMVSPASGLWRGRSWRCRRKKANNGPLPLRIRMVARHLTEMKVSRPLI